MRHFVYSRPSSPPADSEALTVIVAPSATAGGLRDPGFHRVPGENDVAGRGDRTCRSADIHVVISAAVTAFVRNDRGNHGIGDGQGDTGILADLA